MACGVLLTTPARSTRVNVSAERFERRKAPFKAPAVLARPCQQAKRPDVEARDLGKGESSNFFFIFAMCKLHELLFCAVFVCLTVKHRLWMSDRRARHGLQDQSSACFTSLQDEDNVKHIPSKCVYARKCVIRCGTPYGSMDTPADRWFRSSGRGETSWAQIGEASTHWPWLDLYGRSVMLECLTE